MIPLRVTFLRVHCIVILEGRQGHRLLPNRHVKRQLRLPGKRADATTTPRQLTMRSRKFGWFLSENNDSPNDHRQAFITSCAVYRCLKKYNHYLIIPAI